MARRLHAQRRGRLTDGLEISYARGLEVSMYRGLPEVSHSGVTAGYRAFLTRYPSQALSVAVLCNTGNANAVELGHKVADAALGDALAPAVTPSPAAVEAAALARWAGLYRSLRTGEPLRMSFEDGSLRAERRGTLVPVSASLFTLGDGPLRVQFRGEGVGRTFEVIGSDGDVSRYALATEVKPAPADLAQYEGTYLSDEAEVTYTIRAENGALFALRRPDARLALTPAYKDAFMASLGLVLFRRDGRGQVNGLSLGLGRVRDLRFRRVPAASAVDPAAPTGR